MVMDYRLAPAGDGTEVTVDADVTLAGAIAQFGRTGLMQETANILVQDFVRALEAQLAPQAGAVTSPEHGDSGARRSPQRLEPSQAPAPREIRAGSVGLRALWAWLKNLLRGLFSGSGRR